MELFSDKKKRFREECTIFVNIFTSMCFQKMFDIRWYLVIQYAMVA